MRQTFLPYCKPVLTHADTSPVVAALEKGWLTTGPAVRAFEEAFATRTGVKHAIALNSCTAALHAALRAFDVGPGDEVVMPSLTFVAGAECTLALGAKPVFADIDPETWSVTLETIARVVTPATKVIIPMPYGGRPLGVAEIVAFARERNILVLEDAAHAAGMLDDGTWAGSKSDAAAYSFYATKNLTSAEGGMLVTNDDALAARVRSLSLHGMDRDAWRRYSASGSWRYDVLEPGFKYNMPDPLAALGNAQLQQLDILQARRHEIARRYSDAIASMSGVHFQAPPRLPGDLHSWCMFVIAIDEHACGISRDDAIDRLRVANIGTSVHYVPTHLFSGYRSLGMSELPVTEAVWRRLVSLPLSPAMSDADVDDVLDALGTIVSPRQFAVSQGSTYS